MEPSRGRGNLKIYREQESAVDDVTIGRRVSGASAATRTTPFLRELDLSGVVISLTAPSFASVTDVSLLINQRWRALRGYGDLLSENTITRLLTNSPVSFQTGRGDALVFEAAICHPHTAEKPFSQQRRALRRESVLGVADPISTAIVMGAALVRAVELGTKAYYVKHITEIALRTQAVDPMTNKPLRDHQVTLAYQPGKGIIPIEDQFRHGRENVWCAGSPTSLSGASLVWSWLARLTGY